MESKPIKDTASQAMMDPDIIMTGRHNFLCNYKFMKPITLFVEQIIDEVANKVGNVSQKKW